MIADGDPTDEEEEEIEDPEIIGDPTYENGTITIPTTDGEIEVFNANEGGSWSEWEKKAMNERMEKYNELKEKSDRLYEKAKHQSESNDEFGESSLIWGILGTILCFTPIAPLVWALIAYGTLFEVISLGGSSYEDGFYDESKKLQEEAANTLIHGCG
jgi:hypothetical protein